MPRILRSNPGSVTQEDLPYARISDKNNRKKKKPFISKKDAQYYKNKLPSKKFNNL